MNKIRFVMIGGFLGAGKTTTIARLAKQYIDRGLKVGVVTNDQANDLVDTHSLRSQGFFVGEVPGACFCCKFNDLLSTADELQARGAPDVIIAEPVGSCTDLVATVVEPLKQLYHADYDTAPYAVLLKPEHGRKILGDQPGAGFSAKAAYIFLKQIEEADVVVVNKADKLSTAECQELVDLVKRRFPGKEVLSMSAKDGKGFDGLVEAVSRPTPVRTRTMDVDYDVYAEGEAELGWLNCTAEYRSKNGVFALDDLLVEFVSRLQTRLGAEGAETAHLKILAEATGDTAIANLVSSTSSVELSVASEVRVPEATLVVNARVATDPARLTEIVQQEAAALAADRGLTCTVTNVQSFRPGRPTPTHRLALQG